MSTDTARRAAPARGRHAGPGGHTPPTGPTGGDGVAHTGATAAPGPPDATGLHNVKITVA